MAETIKLRGHHLLCILTYRGEGYTSEFIKNFDTIIDAINNGAEIQVASGIDDVCAALRHGAHTTCAHAHECHSDGIKFRDRQALNDVARVLQIPRLKKGDVLLLKKGEIKHLRQHFLRGAIRRACASCSWHELCSGIAQNKFDSVKLFSPGNVLG